MPRMIAKNAATRRCLCKKGARRFFSLLAVTACLVSGSSRWELCRGQDRVLPTTEEVAEPNADESLRRSSQKKWAEEIQRLRRLDEVETYPNDAVLFLGSSSIRLWETIAKDLAPFVPIRRGFGGAQSVDLAVHGPELIRSHRYAAIVLFVANDVSGEEGRADYQPEQVIDWLKEVCRVSQEHQPSAPLLLVEVTPTQLRRHVWPEQRRLNEKLREWTFSEENLYFLPTAEYFLDAKDEVRRELFGPDELHLNREGYRLWGDLIRRRLEELLARSPVPST
ncbi:MAG: hypothetical protein JNL67_17205 [Planctomycetaceae bacterium]|nr:hypothetical protein [Planctomycetaceae bacterium]